MSLIAAITKVRNCKLRPHYKILMSCCFSDPAREGAPLLGSDQPAADDDTDSLPSSEVIDALHEQVDRHGHTSGFSSGSGSPAIHFDDRLKDETSTIVNPIMYFATEDMALFNPTDRHRPESFR
jgi:hypothetical protein